MLTVRLITKALWLLIAAWLLIGRKPATRWRRLIRAAKRFFAHAAAFPVIATGSLAMFLLAVISQHLSLQTSSHDFGVMDEALAGGSGGRFMHSEVLGYSLLGEHFYVLMAALIPFRNALGTPWVTLVAHALLLWAALFPLRALLRHEKVAPWLVNFVCLMYATHPIVARTLSYVFHPEAAYPVCVLTLWWCLKTNRWTGYAVALLATLAIKEDAAVYLIGFSFWIALADRRMKPALLTAAVSLVWLGLALKIWMPAFGAPTHSYRFIARWIEYGATPGAIVLGMLAHPHLLLADLFSRQTILAFAGLGFLPFMSPWGWRVFIVPWIINATSAEPMQAGFALYYGAPVLAFALPAAIAGLRTKNFGRLARSPLGPALALAVALLNVAHFELPRPYAGRSEVAAALAEIPHGANARILPCLYPIGGYWAGKRPLMPATNHGGRPEADAGYVAWLDHHHTWPFSNDDLDRLAVRLRTSGWTDLSRTRDLHLFRRPRLNATPPSPETRVGEGDRNGIR